KVSRDLASAREELDRFQNQDAPAFSRWFHGKFGSLLTELRETTHRIRELQRLLLEVEVEILYSGASEGQAYARVMNRREEGAQPGDKDEEDSPFGADGEERHGHSGNGADEEESEWGEFFGFDERKKSGRR